MKLSTKIFGASIVALSLAATSANAADMTLLSLSFNSPSTVNVNGQNVYLGEATFTADVGGKSATFGAFCVDIYHDITIGALDLPYDQSTLITDSHGVLSGINGAPVSLSTAEEIGGLADYGLRSTDLITQEAVQALIWEDLGATLTNFGANGAAIQQEITNLETLDPKSNGRPDTIYAVNGLTQGFTTGVPEPATWAMMLAGFAVLGAALRQQRRKPALIAAV